jgi:hypothetical protein
MFKNKEIRKRVMQVIDQKIEAAQERHDAEIERLEDELEQTINTAQLRHEEAKGAVVDKLVGEILGKIL